MRRLALTASLVVLALAPAAVARADAEVAGGTVGGIAYQDTNADGAQQQGEAGLAGWVIWADLDGNGMRDATEPSATAGVDGRYSLGPLQPGNYTLRIQEPDGSACPQTAACAHDTVIADGMPATVDFPIVTPTDPPRQLLDEDPVHIGPFKLNVRRSCARKSFYATLVGNGAYRVDFRVDGRLVRSVRPPRPASRFSVRVDPRRMRNGVHTLTAALWFSASGTGPSKQLSAKFRSCAARR